MNIGEKIKIIRQSKNMTQSELAKSLDITQQEVSYIENSKRQLDVYMLCDIARTLEISTSFILHEDLSPYIYTTDSFGFLQDFAKLSLPDQQLIKSIIKRLNSTSS